MKKYLFVLAMFFGHTAYSQDSLSVETDVPLPDTIQFSQEFIEAIAPISLARNEAIKNANKLKVQIELAAQMYLIGKGLDPKDYELRNNSFIKTKK